MQAIENLLDIRHAISYTLTYTQSKIYAIVYQNV